MTQVAARLDAMTGTAQVRVVDAARPGNSVVRADVAHHCVDDVLDELERLAVPAADVSMARVELVGQIAGRAAAETSFVWADVVGVAGSMRDSSASTSRSWSLPGSSGATASSIATRCCWWARWRSALICCRSRRWPSA